MKYILLALLLASYTIEASGFNQNGYYQNDPSRDSEYKSRRSSSSDKQNDPDRARPSAPEVAASQNSLSEQIQQIPEVTHEVKGHVQIRKITDAKGNVKADTVLIDNYITEADAYCSDSLNMLACQAKTAYLRALRKEAETRVFDLQHHQDIYRFQHYTSYIILGMVLLIVLAGLWLSIMQFYLGLSNKKGVKESTTEIALQGFTIKTSVIGLAILTISVSFFLAYLKFVYPIVK